MRRILRKCHPIFVKHLFRILLLQMFLEWIGVKGRESLKLQVSLMILVINQQGIQKVLLLFMVQVTSLNLEIMRALARKGIPSIGMSPFSCGWSTCQRIVRR